MLAADAMQTGHIAVSARSLPAFFGFLFDPKINNVALWTVSLTICRQHLVVDEFKKKLNFAVLKVQNKLKGVAHIVYFKYQKNKIPNSRGYCRPWRIRIRGRFGPEPMQLFANSKNRISAKIRIWCPALHENRHSPQELP